MNGTVPCLEDTVERGVLARVVAELLLIDKSVNQQCGVCSSSQFAAAYLGERIKYETVIGNQFFDIETSS